MKTYVLYDWFSGDEGGQGICLTSEYKPNFNGLNTDKIGEFDTLIELADMLYSNFPDWYVNAQEASNDAIRLWENLKRS